MSSVREYKEGLGEGFTEYLKLCIEKKKSIDISKIKRNLSPIVQLPPIYFRGFSKTYDIPEELIVPMRRTLLKKVAPEYVTQQENFWEIDRWERECALLGMIEKNKFFREDLFIDEIKINNSIKNYYLNSKPIKKDYSRMKDDLRPWINITEFFYRYLKQEYKDIPDSFIVKIHRDLLEEIEVVNKAHFFPKKENSDDHLSSESKENINRWEEEIPPVKVFGLFKRHAKQACTIDKEKNPNFSI